MTVEKHKTLHTPAHTVADLEHRVWVLERERCDCRHKDTVKEPDILLEPPSPPPAQAEPWRIVWLNYFNKSIGALNSLNETTNHRVPSVNNAQNLVGVIPNGYVAVNTGLPEQWALYKVSDLGVKIRDIKHSLPEMAPTGVWYAHEDTIWVGYDRFDLRSAPGTLNLGSEPAGTPSVFKLGRPYLSQNLLGDFIVFSASFDGPGVVERERYRWDSRWFPGVSGQAFASGHAVAVNSGIIIRNFYSAVSSVWVPRNGAEFKRFKLNSVFLVGRHLTLSDGKVYEWGDASEGFIGDAQFKVPPAEVLEFDKGGCQLESFGGKLYMVCNRDTGRVLVVDHVKNEVLYRLDAPPGEYLAVYEGN